MKTVTAKQIYSGNTNSNGLVTTDDFKQSNLLFIRANDLNVNEGYEIASALIIKLTTTEIIGGLPITTNYGEKEIPLNINFLDTENIILIPEEIYKTEFNCFLVLATSYSVNLTIYAVQVSEVTNQEIYDELQNLREEISDVLSEQRETEIISDLIGVGIQFILSGGTSPLLPAEAIKLLPGLI